MKINSIKAKEILTSKGSPTIEVCLETANGRFGASVPSGVSTGKYEAVEIPALVAIKKIAETEPLLVKRDFSSQKEFDCFLLKQDGTKNKSLLGGNTILSLSIAFCRAFSCERRLPLYQYIREVCCKGRPCNSHLPRPCVLLFEGGKHAPLEATPLTGHGVAALPAVALAEAGGGLAFQEILLVPGGDSFREMFDKARIVFEGLQSRLNYPFGVEGGLVAPLKEEAILNLISQQTSEQIGIDVAASSFFDQGKYHFQGKEVAAENLLDFYYGLQEKYDILFFEDPFGQDDIASWRELKLKIKNEKLKIIGDDLTVTNPQRIQYAKENDLCNGVIIKPNQIGTVWETIEAVQLAKKFGWKIIVSHRAGETEDSFIADLAVGVGADFIKAGGLSQEVRLAKYNRLLEIENNF